MAEPWREVLLGSWSPYPWLFETDEGGTLCETCAAAGGEVIVGGREHWEGEEVMCDACGKVVQPAYPGGDE